MTVGLLIPLCCLFFSILIIIIYFSKQRINNSENTIYKALMIINFITLIFEFINSYLTYNQIPIISELIVKIYLILLISFIALMTSYMAIVTCNNKQGTNKKNKIYLIIFIIGSIVISFSDINLKIGSYGAYADGTSTTTVFIVSCIYQIMWLCNLVTTHKQSKNKKYIPFYLYLTIGQCIFFIQVANPGLLLVTPMEMFVVMIMYFTIENPDMKLIN